jgi:hypothetical protein
VLAVGAQRVAIDRANAAPLLPPLVAGGVAFSDVGAKTLRAVDRALQRAFSLPALDILRVAAAVPLARRQVSDWLLRRVAASQAELARRNIQFQRELALLRHEYDDMQRKFLEAEEFLVRQPSPLGLALAVPPSPYGIGPANGVTVGEWVEQALPIASTGLSGIELHVGSAGTGRRASGRLDVEILTPGDGRVHATWQIPLEQLASGWNCFSWRRAFGGTPQSVGLRVRWVGSTGSGPSLSLGPLSPLPEHWLRGSGLRDVRRCLAVKVWRSLPGLRLPSWSGVFEADRGSEDAPQTPRAAESPHVTFLHNAAFSGVRQVSPNAEGAANLVSVEDNPPEIQLALATDGPTIACLPRACPSGIIHAHAVVRPQGEVEVEYALAVLPSERDVMRCATADFDEFVDGFSGWSRVEPGAFSQIRVDLTRPTAGRADLYLFARSPVVAGGGERTQARFVAFSFAAAANAGR